MAPSNYPNCDRRTLLKLLAASTVGASLPWLRSPAARAQSGEVPQRILFIEAGSGVRRGSFEPVVPGPIYVPNETAVTEWAFRDIQAALAPYRSRSTMFQYLDMNSARFDPTGPANAHIGGLTHMLTGDSRFEGSSELGGGPSIDQFIAQGLAASGVRTRLGSLELIADADSGPWSRSENHDAYSAPGQKVPFLKYLPDIWDHVFPEGLTGDTQTVQRRVARRAAGFAFVRGEYDRLIGRLGSEDRTKLEQMRDYRADLHASQSIVSDREGNRPLRSTILTPWSELEEGWQAGHVGNPTWRVHCELMSKMAAAALHTDTTRVVNLSITSPPGYEFAYADGQHSSSDAHDLDHQCCGDYPDNTDLAALATVDRSRARVYEQVAFLLNELATLQETDGQSLLEHTLVVIYSHIADASHDLTRLPWVVIGDAHGYLKTGQYIRFPVRFHEGGTDRPVTENDDIRKHPWVQHGRSHNDLFITLANAMGIQTDTFGNPDVCEGAIRSMIA